MIDREPEGTTGEVHAGHFEGLTENIREKVGNGAKMGVEIRTIVVNGRELTAQRLTVGADAPLPGASLGKLPLAALLIHREPLSTLQSIQIPRDMIDETGGGIFDSPDAPEVGTVDDLVDDMLRRSGNTAYRVLAAQLGGAAAINHHYTQLGWQRTRTQPAENGRVYLGVTTAAEALDQLNRIVYGVGGNELLRQTVIDALENNEVHKHGIRQRVAPQPGLRIFNKTGEAPDDAYAYRHDVGIVSGPEGNISYAVLTRSNIKGRGYIADGMIGQITAEIARTAGAKNVRPLASAILKRFR